MFSYVRCDCILFGLLLMGALNKGTEADKTYCKSQPQLLIRLTNERTAHFTQQSLGAYYHPTASHAEASQAVAGHKLSSFIYRRARHPTADTPRPTPTPQHEQRTPPLRPTLHALPCMPDTLTQL